MKRLAAILLAAALFPAMKTSAEDSLPIVLTEPGTGVSYTCSVTDPDTMSITIVSAQVPEELTDLVIPDILGGCRVTALGEKLFLGCEKLSSVTLPDTLVSVGGMAFSGCYGLREIVLPDGLTELGSSCFAGCGALSSAVLGRDLERIPERCFAACSSLTDVQLPDGLAAIGDEAFFGCGDLTMTVPSSVTEIGVNAIGVRYDLRTGGLAPFDDFLILGSDNSTADSYARETGVDFIDPTDLLSGDADRDGCVDAADASLVLVEYAHLLTGGAPNFSRAQQFRADINSDGTVDSSDASDILRKYADILTGN
ncbi:MAG: leucine-rich repeat protein [Ruminococcus sp.]|nr:leucine-rich repeat protein [Ruminococcus sp.]